MTSIENQKEINKLKKDVFSGKWELVKTAIERLSQIQGDIVVDFLISLLDLNDSGIRNRAALALSDIKDNKAVKPLLQAILKKENHNYNGTMVHALESLDCSNNLKEIFTILFFEAYEAKISAYSILCNQIFNFTRKDILEIKKMWENCKLNPESCPGFENDETREMMQDVVDGYLFYLKPRIKKE